jgi:hypothetical protein
MIMTRRATVLHVPKQCSRAITSRVSSVKVDSFCKQSRKDFVQAAPLVTFVAVKPTKPMSAKIVRKDFGVRWRHPLAVTSVTEVGTGHQRVLTVFSLEVVTIVKLESTKTLEGA